MAVKLNREALAHARKLVKAGKVVRDKQGNWTEHAPDADEENRYVDKRGWDDYALWHLGIDRQDGEETKERYSFPFGDFTKVHRCGVIALQSRANQFDHDDIAKAAASLLEEIGEGEDD